MTTLTNTSNSDLYNLYYNIWGKCILTDWFYVMLYVDRIQCYLLHPHTWIRLISSRLFGLLFASCNMEEIIELLVDEKSHIPEGKVGLDFFAKRRLMNVNNSEFVDDQYHT